MSFDPTPPKEVQTQFFHSKEPLALRCGSILPEFVLAYETYGTLNEARDNAILLFHAMTGSQHAAGWNDNLPAAQERWTDEMHEGWWDKFIGPGRALDTNRFFVICANHLGGCYGSTGPASLNPETGEPFGPAFPVIRFCDVVDSQVRLLDALGITALHAALGGSIGGFLVLSLATRYPERVRRIVSLCSGGATTILQRILNFEQISAIENDPDFRGGNYYQGKHPDRGLSLARRIAHKTFISIAALSERARKEVLSDAPPFAWYSMNHPAESYMLHQGEKFARRFDANSYLRILDAWQWFDLAAESGTSDVGAAVARCRNHQALVFSVD
ncbi:MAG: homoserine O-acetyltransferase, partial [Verrucomicrobiia bacterium]